MCWPPYRTYCSHIFFGLVLQSQNKYAFKRKILHSDNILCSRPFKLNLACHRVNCRRAQILHFALFWHQQCFAQLVYSLSLSLLQNADNELCFVWVKGLCSNQGTTMYKTTLWTIKYKMSYSIWNVTFLSVSS